MSGFPKGIFFGLEPFLDRFVELAEVRDDLNHYMALLWRPPSEIVEPVTLSEKVPQPTLLLVSV
jgi:hypothetical protein